MLSLMCLAVLSVGSRLTSLADINAFKYVRHHPTIHVVTPASHRAQSWSNPVFVLYIPIILIAASFGSGIQQYADDMQLYVALTSTKMHARLSLLSDCLSALHNWFCHNGLALDSSKSESILIGTRQCLCTIPAMASPTIVGVPVPFSETITMLGSH